MLAIGIAGACRREELTKMTLDDVKEQGDIVLINIPDSKTYTSRNFVLCGRGQEYLKKYLNLRPPQVTTRRLFLFYRKSKCTSQVVGINSIGKMPSQIAYFLHLPNSETYTGHCFRRSSATLLADAGGDLMTLKRHGGWKSSSVAEGYVEESVQNKIEIAKKITGTTHKTLQIQQESCLLTGAVQNSTRVQEESCSNSVTSVFTNAGEVPCIKIENMTNSSIIIKIKK